MVAVALVVAPVAHARSSSTAALQVALRAKAGYAATIDGIGGPATKDAVRRLQARRGLAVDGVVGPRTRRALGWRGRHPFGSRTIGANAKGWDVAALQWLLATHGFPSGAVRRRSSAHAARPRSSASRRGPGSAPTGSPGRRPRAL